MSGPLFGALMVYAGIFLVAIIFAAHSEWQARRAARRWREAEARFRAEYPHRRSLATFDATLRGIVG